MAHVITKFIAIGGDVGKIFYNVELIMIIYMNKIANELITGYLELTRCFCDVLLNTSFYIQSNLYRVDGFFDCLRNTITHSHEFITKGLLDKMFNLSEYILPHEQAKPSLITSYCAMLSHFIGNSKSFNVNETTSNSGSSSSNSNYVNYFFDVLLKHMKKIGYDETAKCGDTNDMIMSIEDDNDNNIETLQLCNDNMEINDISLHKHYNTYLTIFHYIKTLHVYNLIPLLNNTNQHHLLMSFLAFFSNHLQKQKSNNIIQQIAKLILLIMVNYLVKPNTLVNKNINNDTLHHKIKNLTFSPLVIETLINAVVSTKTFDDKLNFNMKDMNIVLNIRDISYKQVILLFQVVYTIMFQNVKELLQQRGECVLIDYIETYYVLYKCFESVLNMNDSGNSFYNEFFTETQCFMEQTYTKYFILFIEDEDTFEQCLSYQIDKNKFNITTYNEFKSQLIQNFIHISQRLILRHMNPFIYKAMIFHGKDETIHCILDIIIHLMEFFIDNASSSFELKKFYISNLISFYARLNYALCCCQSDIIVKFIYKRNVKLFCKFLNIFKETYLLYSLIGINIVNARLMLISEIVFDNYVNMYLINSEHEEDEHTRKFICDEFPKMVFNIKQPITQSNNEDNVVNYLTTICYYVDHQSKNKEMHSSLTEIHELLVERKFTMLTGVNISLLFVIKSLLYIHSLHSTNSDISCSSLIDKLEKFSSLLIKELIDNQSTKLPNTKDPFYNRFIDVIKTKTKKQNTKQPIDIYNQLLDICKSQYQACGDEVLTYNAFDVNNTTNKRTPGRKYTKTQTNALSPQQKTNLNLSADVNKHKKMKMSTTSLTTFRTESSSRDEGKGRTTSLIFDNNDYGVNSSNDGSDFQLVEDDSNNKYGGWFSKKANSNDSNSNSNSNSKKKRRDIRSTTTMGLKNNFLSRKFLIENSNSMKDNKRVIDNIYDEQSFKEINNNFSLLNPKRQLLLSHFALEFKNIYFYSESFIKLKHAYFKYTNLPQIRKNTKQLNYPSKIKNFSNTIEPPLFFTYNKHFFNGKYFGVSHQYINNTHKRSNINENRIPFQQRHFPINNNISRYEYKCELITTEYSLYGVITLCKDFIVFQSSINDPRLHKNPEERLKYVFSSAKGDRVIKQRTKCIFYNDIKEMLIRRYLFLWQSIEIFTKDGKSCYFNFFSESNCNEFIKTLPKDSIKARNASVVLLLDKKELYMEMERYSKKWNDNEISTYEYLLYINKYASRSYKEVNQYPIMPWLLNNYNSIFDFNVGMITKKDGKDNKSKATNNGYYVFDIEPLNANKGVNTVDALFKNNFRDLNYPISVQTHDKRNSAISRYRESKEEKKFAYHLGSFYSTSSFIFYYLMRMQPFMDCLIRLQNGVQENTNRMFYSIADTQEVLENSTDNRELIPEFYARIECFINLNCSFFGYKTKKKLVDDIEFNDKRLSTYVQFIIAHRKLLNTYKVSQSVIKWIDYTFGVNQFALKEQNCTVFQKSSYAQKVNFVNKIQSIKKKNQIKNNGVINYEDVFRKVTDKILVVMNFGQAPFQIFNSALSQRKENGNEIFVESKLFGGNNDSDSDNSDNDMNDNENGEGQNDILMMLSYLKEKNTIQHELVIKTKNENICGCYIESINSNNNNNKKDTSYSLASNGQLIINYDIITNQKIKTAIDIKLPGFTLKNRTSINRMIKSNESINYPEYSFCIMNKQKFIITVGYLSNAFQLYDISDKDKKYKFYIMEDFVRSICKTSEHVFLIGLNNGRLLEYEIQYKHNDTTFMSHKCKCKRFIYAHSSSICVIEYIPRLNIIITVGDDNYIYIRKYFNFELLSYISLDSKYKVLSLKVSDVNCVYVLVYDKTQSASANKMKVIGYTLTGIEFAESEYGMYTNMEITTSNNVILGIDETATQSNSNDKKKMNHIMLLKGCSLERIGYMRLKSCEKKSVVYVKYYAKKRMLFYYFKDDIRVSQLEDGEKEIMVF